MAVYYKWIKGCSEGSTLNSGLWSYIKWAGNSTSTPTGKINNLPYLYVAKGKKDDLDTSTDEVKDLGYFLTNKATEVEIEESWKFKKQLICNYRESNSYAVAISGKDEGKENQRTLFNIHHRGLFSINDDGKKDPNIDLSEKLTEIHYLHTIGQMKADKISIANYPAPENGLGVAGAIKSNDSVHAPYFNATSDMRAKENIKKLPFSALGFINNLSVYQFNYKDKNDTIPGVLAQDVLNCQPEGLSLVDNIDASGENGDYMSIKEDKFIFLLMRAVQELKEDNDALRYEIEQLKQKLK